MKVATMVVLLTLSGCAMRQARIAKPSPLEVYKGTPVADYMHRHEPPTEVRPAPEGMTVYTWRWDEAHSETTNNSGRTINWGTRNKPVWVTLGGGSNTTTKLESYWLTFWVDINGRIENFGHSALPLNILKKAQ